MGQIAEWFVWATIVAAAFAITLWMAGAIYFDVCGGAKWARWPALAWIAIVIAVFAVWQPFWQPFVALFGVVAFFLVWWLRQQPSHKREWDPSVAILPHAKADGDAVTLENVRNFDYRSLDDFTPRYETRTFHLANLKSADIIFFTWGSPWMSHPVLVFDFGPDGRICGSIEVRYRAGQQYSVVRSLYRRQELILLVVDERDAILRRTKYGSNQEAHLFRYTASGAELKAIFLDYVAALNRLYDTPRWYHGLCANCTTSFYRLPSTHCRFDWRVLANGRLDRALYEAGRLDRSLPFPELHRAAFINDIANQAPEVGFGEYLREQLEKRRHGQ
jgi:hypothetical protein